MVVMRPCIPYIVPMDWRDLQTFLATAEAGSTQGGSSKLTLDQSTVSRRIAAFEERIGQRLFERLPTGLVLTAAGQKMLATAKQVEKDVHSLERHLVGQDATLNGEVRLTLPPLMLNNMLAPALSDFYRSHPDVHVEIDVSLTEANLTKREADIAVRGSNSPPEHLIGRRVANINIGLYCHEDTASAGLEQNWIGWGEPGEVEAWARERNLPVTGTTWRVDNPAGQMAMARCGMGIAALPCALADRETDLVRLVPEQVWPGRDLWVLTHKDLLPAPRIRSLFNHLADTLSDMRHIFEGRP
jgi:DNA-binding transcriptional LysR family regulator